MKGLRRGVKTGMSEARFHTVHISIRSRRSGKGKKSPRSLGTIQTIFSWSRSRTEEDPRSASISPLANVNVRKTLRKMKLNATAAAKVKAIRGMSPITSLQFFNLADFQMHAVF